ncbi:hypothetical protein B4U79_02605, partial [Dinothrombium tinctorium]
KLKAKTVLEDKSENEQTKQLRSDEQQPTKKILHLKKAIRTCRDLIVRKRDSERIPGMVVGVSVNGKNVWIQGFGYADIETGAKCTENTVMRIASLSKCITMLLVGKLVDEGKIDLNESIYRYLKQHKFPQKFWKDEKVDITVRQLASHLGGIRHYTKENDASISDSDCAEFYLNKPFTNVIESLNIFKDDDLLSKPGTKFRYTTHGYTLLSAVVEQVLPKGETFGKYLTDKICRKDLGMFSTFLDESEPIIFNRAKGYRNRTKLINAPFVDNSYKWAGGGLLSNIPDILKFANVMLYSLKGGRDGIPGYLKKSTVETLWTPIELANIYPNKDFGQWMFYGLGWIVVKNATPKHAACLSPPFRDMIFHDGGAIGFSSYLLIIPEHEIVVAVICNVEKCRGLDKLSLSIAKAFSENIKDIKNDTIIEL